MFMCMYCIIFFSEHISLGALGDSFYEYLIKSWVGTSKNDTEGLNMFNDAVTVSGTDTCAHV